MGNKSGNVTSVDFNPKEWQATDKETSQNQNKGNYKVLQNVKTGEMIDEYQLYWPSEEDFKFYLDSYYWRRQQYNIVPSRYIVQQHSDQFCSRSYGAKVYIEHIQTRLSDVTDIPYPDNLYVALAVLQGYQKLYQNVHHYFPISEDQICVDKEGVVKVWVNSDLCKNYPEPEQATTQNKDQAHMVEELLNIVWENTDEESEPQSFRQFFAKKKGKRRIGFDQAKVIVNEYAKQLISYKIRNVSCQIPQKFNSILQMIEDSDYENQQHQQELDNDQELHNMEQHDQEQYLYNQGLGYERGYEGEEMQQYHQNNSNEEYFVNNGDRRQFYYPYNNNHNQHSQQSIHQQHPAYYHSHHQQQIVSGHFQPHIPPIPHAINPITPIQYRPHVGPLISIPPVRQNITIINPIPRQLQTFNPVAHYHQQQQSLSQVSFNNNNNNQHQQYNNNHQQQYIPINQRQFLHQDQEYITDHQVVNHDMEQQHQTLLNTEVFGNGQISYQQHISTLNPQSGSSSHQVYQPTNQYNNNNSNDNSNNNSNNNNDPQQASRHQLNNSVGRSLQLINQSTKKAQQLQKQKTRINKSHINQLGEIVQVNYPRQYQQQAFNSRISGTANSRMESLERNQRNLEGLQYIREEMLLDTRYYTIDTEVELDEEIAADLKKMIMAL